MPTTHGRPSGPYSSGPCSTRIRHQFLDVLAWQGADRVTSNARFGTRPGQSYRKRIQPKWVGAGFSRLQEEEGEYLNTSQALALLGALQTIIERLLATGRPVRHESRDQRADAPMTLLARIAVLGLGEGRALDRLRRSHRSGGPQYGEVFDELAVVGRMPVALPATLGKNMA